VRDLGHAAAVRDQGGLFRIISAVASPKFLIERDGMFWSKYCDTGRLVLHASKERFFSGRLEDFAEIDGPTASSSRDGWRSWAMLWARSA
jgi:hypothetical protein